MLNTSRWNLKGNYCVHFAQNFQFYSAAVGLQTSDESFFSHLSELCCCEWSNESIKWNSCIQLPQGFHWQNRSCERGDVQFEFRIISSECSWRTDVVCLVRLYHATLKLHPTRSEHVKHCCMQPHVYSSSGMVRHFVVSPCWMPVDVSRLRRPQSELLLLWAEHFSGLLLWF